jgi:dihydroorotate dehydrogenase (NAD+) catalytic subunit
MIDLSVEIGTVTFKNPVMVASGTFGYAEDLNQIGGIVTKTVTLEPRAGNPPPRIAETPAGMLNSIGLPNIGVDGFIDKKMGFLRTLDTKIIVNVAGKSSEDFIEVVARLDDVEGIDAFELNYSCPNVKEGGLTFSSDAKIAENLTREIRKKTGKLLITKLTPNVTSISDIGLAVQNGGADAVSAVNTFVGMAIDIVTRKPKIASITGGLSGPAIKPLALAKVYELTQKLSIPVIAIGGISEADDAIEFLIAGAKAFQIGTANFMNPGAAVDILNQLKAYCIRHGIERLNELCGTLLR